MKRYTIRTVGSIWQSDIVAATDYTHTAADDEVIDWQAWVDANAGDYRTVTDFQVELAITRVIDTWTMHGVEVVRPFEHVEQEFTYWSCMEYFEPVEA